MKRLDLMRCALSMSVAFSLLAGCSSTRQTQGVPEIGMPGVRSIERGVRLASSYQVLYRFTRRAKRSLGGAFPWAPLLNVNGTLYGTTTVGGAGCTNYGCGTIYSMSTTGEKRVIYRFRGGTDDGWYPTSGLIDVNGTLYGTTFYGGGTGCDFSYGCGTVYSVTPTGTETVLHKFTGGASDGAYPSTESLIEINGTLYGTTDEGGHSGCNSQGCGTVYSITTGGSEKMLYAFAGGADGYNPIGLLNVNGTMYGTTFDGGQGCPPQGCGTFYRVDTNGKKKTLHIFGSSDGQGPDAALIDVNGTLYGTTAVGGIGCLGIGCGTVFSVTLNGKTKTLYEFAGGSTDGFWPHGLAYMNGTFYGATEFSSGPGGHAVVYSMTASGQETVLHFFTGVPDGANPLAELIALNGTLYGTTEYGGSSQCKHQGCGTVFALTP